MRVIKAILGFITAIPVMIIVMAVIGSLLMITPFLIAAACYVHNKHIAELDSKEVDITIVGRKIKAYARRLRGN